MASWGENLKEHMLYEGGAISAAVGGKDFSKGDVPAGTTFWAAAAKKDGKASGEAEVDSDAAWARCYKADGEQQIEQDDGTKKGVQIIEFQTICNAFKHDLAKGPIPNGVWIGGQKHSVTRKEEEISGDYTFLSMICMRPGEKGFVAVSTDGKCAGKACVVMAEFDKANGATAPNAKIAAVEFAKWLKESGSDKADSIAA